jgi:hypothetical protein
VSAQVTENTSNPTLLTLESQKSDDIGASIRLVATAINQLTAQQKEFCNLLREILTQCLQSRAN